jgi:hypothetical protein
LSLTEHVCVRPPPSRQQSVAAVQLSPGLLHGPHTPPLRQVVDPYIGHSQPSPGTWLQSTKLPAQDEPHVPPEQLAVV